MYDKDDLATINSEAIYEAQDEGLNMTEEVLARIKGALAVLQT
jgi:hypothetical protein